MKILSSSPGRFALAAIWLLPMGMALFGQEQPPSGNGAESFENHGEATVGFRLTDVKGYRPQYDQLFNLRDGFRLFDFHLHGDARERTNRFADDYNLSMSGIGGEPFATAGLGVTKTNLYNLQFQWRQSYYYRNHNDDVVLPITAAAPALSTGLTDHHDRATVRKFGSATMTIHATNRLRFNAEFYRNTTDGSLLTTRSPEFFGAPSYWAAFARANPYPLVAPVRDDTHRFAAGVDYSWRDWDFHYKAGYQAFNETVVMNLVQSPEVSINPASLSASQPLTHLSWSQTRNMTSPVSEFSYRGELNNSMDWRGGYVYQRYRGPATLDMSFGGIGPSSSGALEAYSVSEGGRANVTEPYHAINQGVTFRVGEGWALNADYRYSRYTSETRLDVQSVFNGTTPSRGARDIDWQSSLHDLSLNMVFTPRPELVLSPGVRLSSFDIESRENGIIDEARTLDTTHVRPELRFGYRPWSRLSFKGALYTGISERSYTAISPHTTVAGHLAVRFEILSNLSLENTVRVVTADLAESDYENRIRANTFTLSYALNDRFSVYGGLSYDSYFARGDIVYARGTSPLTSSIRDQEIHRIWHGGFDAKPLKYFGIRVSASYDRLTGVGEILGEPPAYGPLTWPLATGTVYVEDPRLGRLSFDFQRTYYIEEIVPANNFSANLLTIRYTRGF